MPRACTSFCTPHKRARTFTAHYSTKKTPSCSTVLAHNTCWTLLLLLESATHEHAGRLLHVSWLVVPYHQPHTIVPLLMSGQTLICLSACFFA